MNVFLCDGRRAVLSFKMLVGAAVMMAVLLASGVVSDPFRASVPLMCTFPYTTAWLGEYQNNYVRYSVYRSGRKKYILSKFICSAVAGGILEAVTVYIYGLLQGNIEGLNIIVDQSVGCNIGLLALSGMLWGGASSLLAAITNSRYIAYGGSFIIYYFLVILQERYFANAYFLNPCHWYDTEETVSGAVGIAVVIQLSAILIIGLGYYFVLRRKLKNV